MDTIDPRQFAAALERTGRFFMGVADVQHAVRDLCAHLDEAGIPYAVAGAMALGAYGYERATRDVDILLTPAGLAAFKGTYLGRGYVERFPGSRGMRDTRNKVDIDVLLTGDYPGDGKPKPVRFPSPVVGVDAGGVQVLPLDKLVELKLASGQSAPHRLKDLADVLEVIRARDLPAEFATILDPSVRDKYQELWQAAASARGEHGRWTEPAT